MSWWNKDKADAKVCFPHIVCQTCGLLVSKDRAKSLEVFGAVFRNEYYCSAHAKPYDRCIITYRVRRYYRYLEVDRLGCPVGYVEAPTQS